MIKLNVSGRENTPSDDVEEGNHLALVIVEYRIGEENIEVDAFV